MILSVIRAFRLRHSFRTAVLFLGLAGMGSGVVCPPPAMAQDQALRTIEGKVTSKDNSPIKGAVVYLKDGHTLAIKSYIAGDDGGYRFGQLSSNSDYTLWAESAGKKSGTKSISSFDTKTDFNIQLKIDK